MSYLLDTHALLFFLAGDDALPALVRQIIQDRKNVVYVSAVSLYEITLKYRLGKLGIAGPFLADWRAILAGQGFEIRDLTAAEAVTAAGFDAIHRDPFDRMLAAQSILGRLRIVSRDAALDRFGVDRLWLRADVP